MNLCHSALILDCVRDLGRKAMRSMVWVACLTALSLQAGVLQDQLDEFRDFAISCHSNGISGDYAVGQW